MAPPLANLHLDVDAVSGICGSISIACWVIVFTPQLIANWTSGSAEALSVQFVLVWLIGDVFNIAGALLQGVLPTMIILAVYYTLADVVLLGQCFYYRGLTLRDEAAAVTPKHASHSNGHADERTALLPENENHSEHRPSDWAGLSPAVPHISHTEPPPPPPSTLQSAIFNAAIVLMVCAAGVVGWILGQKATGGRKNKSSTGGEDAIEFNMWGQIFGYLCAVFYIASRVPQLLLNYRRKTTEGLSMLFFIFACLGNATYVLSIFAYDTRCAHHTCRPGEAARIYAKYLLVNLSWLAGATITLLMDLVVFCQYFYYSKNEDAEGSSQYEDEAPGAGGLGPREALHDPRPLLQRGDSSHG